MLKDLPENVEILLMADFAMEAKRQVLTIKQFVRSRVAMGMNKEEIKRILLRDLEQGGPLFRDFRTAVKATNRKGIENIGGAQLYAKSDPNKFYDWIIVGDNRVCPDCVERGGYEPRTLDEWRAIGLPREGATVCGADCRCLLSEVGRMKPKEAVIRE